MSDADTHALSNPKEAAILKLIQDKIAARLSQLENERAANDSSLESWQTDVNGYTEIANRFVEELDKLEAQAQEAAKPNINIEISEDHTPTGKKVPLTTRETKTGPLHKGPGAKPGDTPTNGTKSDKAQSLNEVPEEKKTNPPQKRPVPTTTPKPPTKAEKQEKPEKPEKPAVPKTGGPGKKPAEVKKPGDHEEKKEGEATAEGSAESQEKAPEPTNAEECVTAIKALNKKVLNDSADLISTTSDPAGKVLEAVSIILGEKTDTESVKRLVKAADFVKKLEGVNAESISNQNFTKAKNILKLPKFQPENIKSKNNAIVLFAKWAHFILKVREAKAAETAEANGTAAAQPEEEKINANPEESKTDAAEEGGIISKADVAALKAKKSPPAPVNAVLDATCIALKLAPKHIGGKKTYDHGALLNTADLIKKINSLDVTKVPRDTVKKLREYTEKEDFKPEKVEAVPGAAGLCKWILSIIEHDDKNPAPEKPASTEKAAPEKTEKAEKAEKPTTAPGKNRGPTPAATTGAKKDEKKEEKKEEKKPATPAPTKGKPATTTPATGGAKTGAKKEEEAKKEDGPAVPEFAELKAILKPLTISGVKEMKAMANPPEPTQKIFGALSHLLQNKDIAWKEVPKTYLADLATLQKSLTVDVPALPQANVDGAKKFIADSKLNQTTASKMGSVVGIIFSWIEAAIKLHEQKQAGGSEPAATTEEHKQEEPKEAAATETKEATPQKAENKEAAPEQIPVKEETPAVVEHKEEPKAEEQPAVIEQPKVEEQPAVIEQPKVEEQAAPVREEPKVEQQAAPVEEPKVEEQPKAEEPQTNGDHAAPEPVANHVEHKAEEEKNDHAAADNKQVVSDLSELLGYNVESEVTNGNVKEFIQGKVREIETQISSVTNQNGELRREGVQEAPEKKPYEVKESTKGFIEMVEPGWVSELLDNQTWDEKIYQILVLFFLVQGNTDVPDINDKEGIRAYAAGKLKAEEGHIVGYFLGVEKRLEIDTATKVKIQEYVKDKSAILNPNTFDGVDGLCGVISFLMKEISEYLGVIPLESAKKISAKEKIYLLNNEKIEFYNQRENKIIEIAHKHGVTLDS